MKKLYFVLIFMVLCQPVYAARYAFSQDGFSSTGMKDGSYAFNQGRMEGIFETVQDINGDFLKLTALKFSGNDFFDEIGQVAFPSAIFTSSDPFNFGFFITNFTSVPPSKYLTDQGAVSVHVDGTLLVNDPFTDFKTVFTVSYFDLGNSNSLSDNISVTSNASINVTELPSQVPLPGALGLFMACSTALGFLRRKKIV